MHNARAVRRCQTCRNLRRNIDRLARGQRPLFNKRPQRFARHQFVDDVRRMLVEPDVVDRHDVGMVQRRRQARLLFETPPPLGILRPRFRQHFERDLPPHAGVQGFVDYPHPARAQLPQDLIRPDRPFRHLSSVNRCHVTSNKVVYNTSVNRRDFLRSASAVSAGLAFPKMECLFAEEGGWRTFEVKTRVEILKSSGATRVWLPAALITGAPFQRTLSNGFSAEGGTASLVKDRADGLGIVAAEFPAGVKPILTLTSRVATKNYAVDLSVPGKAPKADRAELEHFRRPTKLLPTDGIVKTTATEITRGARTDLEKARAIFEWIVDNTFRDPKTRGCGQGDIRAMLQTGNLSGKCADLNAHFVGMARSVGIPARVVYGLRINPSQWGYRSMCASGNVT